MDSLREDAKTLRRELAGFEIPPLTAGELAVRWRETPPRRIPGSPEPGSITRLRGAGRAAVEEARERADQDEHGAFIRVCRQPRSGEPLGSLSGIPFTVKDIVDVAGMPATFGSRFARTPARSAPAWRALEEAGATLIGKTNLHEWAFGVTGENPHFGTVRNPRDPSRIAGGSSSGSAAALAAGIGYGSIGSDTGGSIRIPAALTGIVGLKPSFGRISAEGVTPLSWSLDHVGPMARSAADLDIIWSVLAGVPERLPAPASPRPLEGFRVGVPERFFFTNLIPEADQAIRAAYDRLSRLGAEIVSVEIPEAHLAAPARNLIAFAEAAAFHRERMAERPGDFGADVRSNLEAGSRIATEDFLLACSARRLVTDGFSQVLGAVDALVVPSTPAGAPEIGAPTLENGEPTRSGLMRLTAPFNLTGHPALQLPMGEDARGLPLGAQIVGKHGGEDTLLLLARWLESAPG